MEERKEPFDTRSLKKGRTGISLIILGGLAAALFLTHDIIITNILAASYCSQEPTPKTFIKKKVAFPESIYFEDNIYEGFDKTDRKLMIQNYLDGLHVHTLALRGTDKKIYVYEAGDTSLLKQYDALISLREQYLEEIGKTADKELKKQLIDKNIKNNDNADLLLKQYVQSTVKNVKVYASKKEMPKLNYTVRYDIIPLSDFERNYIYQDKAEIIETATGETIAYNYRLMRRWYILHPDISHGNRYYYPHAVCGNGGKGLYGFDEEVLNIDAIFAPSKHLYLTNSFLYEKYYKGQKR